MKRLSGLLIGTLFAMLTIAAWGFANRPSPEPAWPSRIQGFAFQPYQKDQDAERGDLPTLEQIDSDLKLLAGKTQAVRTYSTTGTPAQIPAMAAKHGIAVTVGAWLNRDHAANDREVDGAIRLAKLNKNVTRVLVGNEVMLRGDLAFEDLVAQLDRVRDAVKQPVSTAEPWNIWLENPELAAHVDFIAVHILPYWEGLEVEQSVDHVMKVMGELQAKFPGKPIVIGEVGWPSDGRTRNAAA